MPEKRLAKVRTSYAQDRHIDIVHRLLAIDTAPDVRAVAEEAVNTIHELRDRLADTIRERNQARDTINDLRDELREER